VPPPPAPSPVNVEVLAKYPLPWVIGPYGDVWVAADVEQFDPDREGGVEKIKGPNGTWWRSKVAKPRHVFDAENLPADVTAFIVDTLNASQG
jgi:hypothetical protein